MKRVAGQQAVDAQHMGLVVQANEQLVLAALTARDAAESARQSLDELARCSQRDELTGTPNRTLLIDRLQHAISHAHRHETGFAVLFVDLDHFKHINDTRGHATGDEVLCQVARRLESAVRDTDTVSRYGGDEFVILLSDAARQADAAAIAGKVLAALAEPLVAEGNALEMSASIGISLFPQDGSDAPALIARADEAMYAAKQQGRGRLAFFRPAGARQEPRRHSEPGAAGGQAALGDASPALPPEQDMNFLAAVVHELRGPLAPLRNAAELLARTSDDQARQQKLGAVIARQVARMDRLIGDLLQVARGSTGKFRLEHAVVDMHGVFASSVEACRPAIESRRQHLQIDIPERVPEVRGDAVRLTQVFGNLLDNASRYTPAEGHIALAVVVEPDAVKVAVSDTGLGISADALPHIFDLFTQEPRAVGMNSGGLGLGLWVVRDLVHAHGGTVTARSEGHLMGSEFRVSLPVARAAQSASP
ncbi:diguanylate cyclase domain-containing protein [Piscinibacter gummiphilus]|uniref:histidine kinase n=1 Tax=Piscinibacter gummiphilus TaxID=946333 RepID=A0ABZ0D0I9_9BURK|nr:diguanylate cyclase [Piscinibacter gummiphilus]WOB10714.1 diguanylate cyclase [Piscinibacter gummiphilus]